MTDPAGFVGWAIVELFGHKRLAGLVTSHPIAGGALVRIDVPETPADEQPKTPAYTKLVGLVAIYTLTPVTEEVARRAARELERWNDPLPVRIPTFVAVGGRAVPSIVAEAEDDGDVGFHGRERAS